MYGIMPVEIFGPDFPLGWKGAKLNKLLLPAKLHPHLTDAVLRYLGPSGFDAFFDGHFTNLSFYEPFRIA
jgi:hypothetical protein